MIIHRQFGTPMRKIKQNQTARIWGPSYINTYVITFLGPRLVLRNLKIKYFSPFEKAQAHH